MTRIAVSNNSLVDFSPGHWRLIQIEDLEEPKLVAEAKTGAPFRYNGYFAVSRDLPESGEISRTDLGQVVLGWSRESESWQLGLTLAPEFTLLRASRWFELLRLAHPDASVYEATATQLGNALAKTLGIPFVSTAPMVEAEPPQPEPTPLVELPLELGMWRLEAARAKGAADGDLQLTRAARWLRGRQRQIAWYALLIVVYSWVAIATLTSELGLPNAGTLIPNPAWLPYLGLAVALLLALTIARQIWLILREPDTLLIKPYEKTISAWRGEAPLWQVKAGTVQSVYVSEVVKKRGRRATVFHSEINLHLLDGGFLPVVVDQDKVVDAQLSGVDAADMRSVPEGVHVLEPDAVQTAAQAAAIHIAVTLGELPVWYDRRLR